MDLNNPSEAAWKTLCTELTSTTDLDPSTLEHWPDSLRVAPPEWREESDPKLQLCRAISGLYVYQKGQNYTFHRIYADGALFQASVGSPHSRAQVIRDVQQWFGRELRTDPSQAHAYTFDGQTLRCEYTAPAGRVRISATFPSLGKMQWTWTFLDEERELLRSSDFLGDGADIAPERVNINTADQARLSLLPGVTPRRAKAIVAYRAENGSFAEQAALLKVRGIGDKLLAQCGHLLDC
ncbi:MAG: competence ComEA-like helix-hairpin-helix protein [Cognaticolwellia sp.]|jgi:competence ComEA-like helix-hairpin-helix protein